MTGNVSSRVALVTGAASDKGIGRAIALGFGRHGRAEDIVGAALSLASEQAAYNTGATITVDGGATCGSMLPVTKSRKQL